MCSQLFQFSFCKQQFPDDGKNLLTVSCWSDSILATVKQVKTQFFLQSRNNAADPGWRISQLPFIGAISHISLRVILSWIFIGTYQLKAVAFATGTGWVLVNLFWSVMLIHKKLLPES